MISRWGTKEDWQNAITCFLCNTSSYGSFKHVPDSRICIEVNGCLYTDFQEEVMNEWTLNMFKYSYFLQAVGVGWDRTKYLAVSIRWEKGSELVGLIIASQFSNKLNLYFYESLLSLYILWNRGHLFVQPFFYYLAEWALRHYLNIPDNSFTSPNFS